MPKQIWIPSSEMNVRVTQEGEITVWEDMQMNLRSIDRPTGFNPKEGSMTTYRERLLAGEHDAKKQAKKAESESKSQPSNQPKPAKK